MPSRARLIDEWLQNATGLPPAILQRIDSHITGPNDRRSFALWRDIISGTLVQTLQVPLMNPARQRRAYMHLARGWTDQASAAARLVHYPDMGRLVPALHGRSLDCELHASLLAFDLGLVADNEQRASWWWILAVTRARGRLGLVRTWEARWAQAWGAVAAALLLVSLSDGSMGSYPALYGHSARFGRQDVPAALHIAAQDRSTRTRGVRPPVSRGVGTYSHWSGRGCRKRRGCSARPRAQLARRGDRAL